MRVVVVSKALVVGAYQRKAEEIARLGVDLTVLIPPCWRDRRGEQAAERCHIEGYDLRTIPLRLNGNYHLHFYPSLARELHRLRPDIVHVDEEPYNLATFLGVWAARRSGARPTFFTWQNLSRRYPPPFRWMEQAVYRACPVAMAGNTAAAAVLRGKGYRGEIAVIPQFGVDPMIFAPVDRALRRARPGFHIGYAGGLLPEKGIDLLLRACAGLRGTWRLSIVGSGRAEADLRALAEKLGIAGWVTLGRRIASDRMPGFHRSLDVLVLPSRTRPHWKEQFGRVLIEAMACGVPVVGSNSGEIPRVIGDAGLVFPEEDIHALRAHLQRLLDEPATRRQLAEAGRRRVLERFTMQGVAQETVRVYEGMMG